MIVAQAPFIVGIYEDRGLEEMDHKLAHLIDGWFAEGGAALCYLGRGTIAKP